MTIRRTGALEPCLPAVSSVQIVMPQSRECGILKPNADTLYARSHDQTLTDTTEPLGTLSPLLLPRSVDRHY